LGLFPLQQIAHVWVSERLGLKLFGREIILEEFQPMGSQYLIVTDSQADDIHSHNRALHSIARYKAHHNKVGCGSHQ